MWRRRVGGTLVLLCCLAATGCASFKAGNLPEIPGETVAGAVTRSGETTRVFSRWELESSKSTTTKAALAAVHESDFQQAIEAAGCCEIVESLSEADLVVDGTAVDHTNPAALIPAVITGVSLYTIPSWVTERVDIRVTATAGERSERYALTDSVTLVQWLPMIVVFPFTGGPLANAEEMRANTYRNLVSRIAEDGLL